MATTYKNNAKFRQAISCQFDIIHHILGSVESYMPFFKAVELKYAFAFQMTLILMTSYYGWLVLHARYALLNVYVSLCYHIYGQR